MEEPMSEIEKKILRHQQKSQKAASKNQQVAYFANETKKADTNTAQQPEDDDEEYFVTGAQNVVSFSDRTQNAQTVDADAGWNEAERQIKYVEKKEAEKELGKKEVRGWGDMVTQKKKEEDTGVVNDGYFPELGKEAQSNRPKPKFVERKNEGLMNAGGLSTTTWGGGNKFDGPPIRFTSTKGGDKLAQFMASDDQPLNQPAYDPNLGDDGFSGNEAKKFFSSKGGNLSKWQTAVEAPPVEVKVEEKPQSPVKTTNVTNFSNEPLQVKGKLRLNDGGAKDADIEAEKRLAEQKLQALLADAKDEEEARAEKAEQQRFFNSQGGQRNAGLFMQQGEQPQPESPEGKKGFTNSKKAAKSLAPVLDPNVPTAGTNSKVEVVGVTAARW